MQESGERRTHVLMRTRNQRGRLPAAPKSLIFALSVIALFGNILSAAVGGGGRLQVAVQVPSMRAGS